ncbi:uncharacterized protein LOC117100826 [Anneissia japonica]|uniref:uncharacterized protein LOC117100826 n=1 Tax=Anneissia japonica TaxID=1529436 RepID=UPI00142578DC|nr:uncharacterized protein LOC117100826 [Anneissia japonica]
MIMFLDAVVFLSVAQLIFSAPREGGENVCSTVVTVVTHPVTYYYYYSQTRGSRACGFLGWSRCTTYGQQRHRGMQRQTHITYSTNYFCCNEWAEDGLGGCPIPLCVPECGAGGTCVSPNNCSCFSGFEGQQCVDIYECNDNNGGCQHLCINTEGSYYCQCYMGYDEVNGHCEAACHPPCVHGECKSPDYCECEDDYVGADCSDIDECRHNNGGCAQICNNFPGGFQCECIPGYALSMLTECLPVCEPPCENNGRCTGPNYCDCPETYFGDICEKDIDECFINNGGCEHNCDNFPGSFSCSCYDGFAGTSNCTDIDECTFANCHNCTNAPGSFECICKEGYEAFDFYNCEDIDECLDGTAGCTQRCSNTVGSFICDCYDGWTLNPDEKSCTANPCVDIGVPFDGTRNCTGFTTGESCVFECEWNYRLLGSNRRECLPNAVWGGQLTQCAEILCPELSLPNGYIFYPCENNVGSRCMFGCDLGYFLEGDSITQCQLSGLWNNSASVCKEIQVCSPSPCVKGVCRPSENEANRYFCDCTGTGYTGTNCEDGFITTPKWPEIWVGHVYDDLEFIAKPMQTLILTIMANPSKVVVYPTELYFTPKSNIQTVSIQGVSQGFTQITYVLRGKGATEFKSLNDDELFVFQNNTHTNGYVYGTHFTPGFQLPSGCFELSDESICLGRGAQFRSTDKWKTTKAAAQTTGVVSIATNSFELPINLIGYSTTGNGKTIATSFTNCQSQGLTVDVIQEFVQQESFYRNYTRQLEHILPDWITFISVNIDPRNSKTSFSTSILRGNEVKSTEWCTFAPVINDGQYSVYLLYKAELTVGGRHVTLPLPPYKGKYCFIVGVCNITSGTVMMMFPEGSRDIMKFVKDINVDDSLKVEINGLAFSTTEKLNPNGRYGQQDDNKISIFVNLQYAYNINQTVSAKLEGSGDIHVTLEDITQLFSHLFTQRWMLQQFGESKVILFWKVLGEDVSLDFKSNQVNNPILNANFGNLPSGRNSYTSGIVIESSTSQGVFDDTAFSWLLKPQNIGSPAEVFVYYDLSPSLSIPSDLKSVTEIVNKLQDMPTQLSTLAENLLTSGFHDMYSTILSTTSYLNDTINSYFQVLSGEEIKSIGNSLSELRIQCKGSLKALRYVNDTLYSNSNIQYNDFKGDLHNITHQLEKLCNQALIELQNVFVHETTTGSGFRMTSEVCLSSYLCFPSLKVEVSMSNSSCQECTELQIDSSISTICIRGKYAAKEMLNRFVTIPTNAKFSLALQSNVNHWSGCIPVLTNIFGIEQMTTLHLTMSGTYFYLTGKLWGLFDMEGFVSSELDSFESMVLHVNGNFSVEGPFSLGRIIKDKIITLSQKSLDDSERRLEQGVKSVAIVESRLNVVLEEERLKKAKADKARKQYASANNDLLVANKNVERARDLLEDQRNYTQEIEDYLNSVCEVRECRGVCLPGSTIFTVIEDVYAYVPYECCDERTESAVVLETTTCCKTCRGTRAVRRSFFGLNPFRFVFTGFSLVTGLLNFGRRRCYSRYTCCNVCRKPVEISVMYTSCSTCVHYQIVGQVEKIETEEVACSTQMPDANCVRSNEQCRKTRNRLFDQLKLTTPDLSSIIEELDNAVLRASLAEASLNEAVIKLQDAVSQHEEVLIRVQSLQAHLNNTQNALNEINANVKAGLAIRELQINGSIEGSLEFKGLQFDIDLVGEETTVIPVVCHLSLAAIPVQIQIHIDLKNLEYSLENAALFMTEELFGDITRSVRRRREASQRRIGLVHGRNRRGTITVIEQPPMNSVSYNLVNSTLDYNISKTILRDQNVVQNEARCKDFNDILGFVEHSFDTLLEVANISKVTNVPALENVDNFHSEYIYNLSISSSNVVNGSAAFQYFNLTMNDIKYLNSSLDDGLIHYNLSKPTSEAVNTSAALQYFNLTVDDIQYLNSSLETGLEQNALIKVIYSAKIKANNTKSLLEVDDVLSRWEVVMEEYTRNFSGLADCEGFHDCLTTELIALKYLSENRQIYQKVIIFDEYISTLLDKNTLNVNEALTAATNVLNQIYFLQNNNDICLRKPTITKHPVAEIVAVEGNDVIITCLASGYPSPTYSWKFNGETLSGRHTNSLLLKQVNASDSGAYTCHASNKVTSVQSEQCELTVEFVPSIIEHPQDADIEQGNPEGIFFTCEASALPLPNYQWYFQASLTSTMKAIAGENASGIEILSPIFSQEGWYTCEAWNTHGMQMSNRAKLNVLGVSIPEFFSDITITLYQLDGSNSTHTNESLINVISEVIGDDEPELALLNYKEFSPVGKTFLTEISFDVRSANFTWIDIANASRKELAYHVQDKIELVRDTVAELNDLLTLGETFEHRGGLFEVTGFNALMNGPICPDTQYAHQDGYICVNCPPGTSRGNDNLPATCRPCPRGYYQPNEGKTGCLVCDSVIITEPGSRYCPVSPYEDISTSGTVTLMLNGGTTNVLNDTTTEPLQINKVNESGERDEILVYAIGGGAGGFVCLVLVVGLLVFHFKKKNQQEKETETIFGVGESEIPSSSGIDNLQAVDTNVVLQSYKEKSKE